MTTLALEVFTLLARAIVSGQALMTRRSEADKEYFLQDWFAGLLMEAGYGLQVQGRNSTPDFLVARAGIVEGYELKSLANVRSDRDPTYPPCRTDVDFNSSIPCGRFVKKRTHRLPRGIAVPDDTTLRSYYLFALYEPVDTLHLRGIALVLADGDFLNNDLELAEGHRTVSEEGFGSYGDAFIRTRKMYRFPNPLTDPDFRYRTLFVSQDAGLEGAIGGPVTVGQLRRVVEKQKTEVKTGVKRVFYAYEVV
jgi:hypothetical protein